jgi:hypothetical protein
MRRREAILGALLLGPALAAGVAPTGAMVLAGSVADLTIEGELDTALQTLIHQWIERSSAAVVGYYGRFPVPRVELRILPVAGAGVRGGQAFPGDVPLIRARVGQSSTAADLMTRDWVMVHEMIHLAFPWMNRRHNWLAEGLAVYVESIARLHAGHLDRARVWGDFMRSMPKGLPRPGEGGFDVTVTWGRTYWGGALFCLLADLRLRAETGGRFGLQHALRAINAKRDFRQAWDLEETLAIGDEATGRTVLASLYAEMRTDAVMTDLPGLWRDLGLGVDQGLITFSDTAPMAALRHSIETPL